MKCHPSDEESIGTLWWVQRGNQDNQDNMWTAYIYIYCITCSGLLTGWINVSSQMLFPVVIKWVELEDNLTDCYFCKTNILHTNKKFRYMLHCLNLPSIIRLLLHSEYVKVPRPSETCSADDTNESYIKCNDTAKHSLLTENQHVNPLSQPSCLSAGLGSYP